MFNGTAISPDREDVTVLKSGKRSKQLSIESVKAGHAGEYSCVVSNSAGATQHSAVLDVNGTTVLQLARQLQFIFCFTFYFAFLIIDFSFLFHTFQLP